MLFLFSRNWFANYSFQGGEERERERERERARELRERGSSVK